VYADVLLLITLGSALIAH